MYSVQFVGGGEGVMSLNFEFCAPPMITPLPPPQVSGRLRMEKFKHVRECNICFLFGKIIHHELFTKRYRSFGKFLVLSSIAVQGVKSIVILNIVSKIPLLEQKVVRLKGFVLFCYNITTNSHIQHDKKQ